MKDKAIEKLLQAEKERQLYDVELIPSENYVSDDVLEALGSVFTNKYSEGYPGKRYYGGQENTDQVEALAIERAKKLFHADHANVQPHSGASANEAVYYAWLESGDTVLAMDLSHGGHLTHGAPVTRSAKQYNFIRYKVKNIETGEIDYDELRALAIKHQPKIILAGFSSYSRELDYEKFAEIGNEVGALLVADVAHIAGLIAGGVAKNPLDYGFHVLTTTTHKTLRGPRGGMILSNGTVSNPLKAPEKTIENIPTLIDRAVFPGTQGGPQMHSIAAKAVALYEASQPEFKKYAQSILDNSTALADALLERGFKLISGGTSNHMMVVNIMESYGIDGRKFQQALESVGITLNSNVIPDDHLPAFAPSGVRLGTPALTTKGFNENDMVKIADWLKHVAENINSTAKLEELKKEIRNYMQTRV